MDDSQCRVCLAEIYASFSVFKNVNGVAIKEMLDFVAELKIRNEDNFSKFICKKCCCELCTAYILKKKCMDTDRTLKNLERKFQTKLEEKVQELIKQNDIKEEHFETQLTVNRADIISDQEDIIIIEEPPEDEKYFEVYTEEVDESQVVGDYENVEYLESDMVEDQNKFETESTELKEAIIEQGACEYCVNSNYVFKNNFALARHQWEVHQIGDVNPLVCSTCDFLFDGGINEDILSNQMKKHFEAHLMGMMNSCPFCPEVFRSKYSLEDHINKHHKCHACKLMFASILELHKHLQVASCKKVAACAKPFMCYICNEFFAMGIEKKRHIQDEHSDKAGADCPLCVRCKIPSAVAFENHFKTHFAEPRFCCSYCGKSFYESDRMQTHIRRFHLPTKLICYWCNKSFRDKSGIARHILGVHFNQRNHRCQLCDKAFTANYNLKEHLFSVHKQSSQAYKCQRCANTFLYRKQFERHRSSCDGKIRRRR